MPRSESSVKLINLSTTERDTIITWESGDVIFNTTTLAHEFYNGLIWVSISTNAKTPGFISCPFNTNIGSSYQTAIPRFVYGGTDTELSIQKIEAIVYLQQANVTMSVRVFDLTNANTIAEVSNIGLTTPSIVDLGTISNLPTTEAIFEVQILRDNNPSRIVYIDSLTMSY